MSSMVYSGILMKQVKQEEEVKAEIAQYGEERARKAGAVLDVSKDGYFNVEKCIPDFLKVSASLTLYIFPLYGALHCATLN